jgi:predicted ATPase
LTGQLSKLSLTNFKCFSDETIPLAPLTLLAGLNGMGKSSVLQSLLLLRQSYLEGSLQEGRLLTAGPLVDLGSLDDLWFDRGKENFVEIGIAFRDNILESSFRFDLSEGLSSVLKSDEQMAKEPTSVAPLALSPLFTGSSYNRSDIQMFHYLTADRHGPRKFLPMSPGHAKAFDLGTRGEFVLEALGVHQDSLQIPTSDPRSVPAVSQRLRDQLEVWLGTVSPGVRLSVRSVPEADLMVSGYSFGESQQLRSRDHRATNVGFGLSYVLPVLVALLAAPVGSLVLIENPEAHLHPQGQTRIGELCAKAAAAGIQVVIETHSDHLMDGVRIAVRDGIVAPEEVLFHYFTRTDGAAEISTPLIDREGRLTEWPAGFFDQHRRNTARLVRPKI